MRPLLSFIFILCLTLSSAKHACALSIDLHSHLFMQEGVGPLLKGRFEDPAGAADSSSRFRTKMTKASLDASGLRLIVLSFYAHPVLTLGRVKEALVSEIADAEKFVAANPSWVIASEPKEARAALAAGKRVFVFSIETAGGVLESDEDQEFFITRKKVRLVTFMHLSPDALGRGVALWPGVGFFNAPLEYFQAWWKRSKDGSTDAWVNPYGLSDKGKRVLSQLVKRHVWIDLAHASDHAVRDMIPILDLAGQPSLITHTKLREFARNERTVPTFILERLARTRGVLGLIPTDDMTEPFSGAQAEKRGLLGDCRRGIRAYAEEWLRAREVIGFPEGVALGSDFNAPLRGLSGGCETAASDDVVFSQNGFYRGDDLPKLSHAMRLLGVDSPDKSEAALQHFLDAWRAVR
ncbi:MAG: membrane dipeptidase [Cryobacterium sp.]|nr:membrane dipeptidase [Oligoflexia bacterium]